MTGQARDSAGGVHSGRSDRVGDFKWSMAFGKAVVVIMSMDSRIAV